MTVLEWFVGFHRPWAGIMGAFGHVEMWGYTQDDTWIFLDPRGRRTNVLVTHHYDDVLIELEARYTCCDSVLKLQPNRNELFPLHFPMTCAGIVGHHFGVRALTPAQLKRRLLRIGAEVVYEAENDTRSSRGSRAEA